MEQLSRLQARISSLRDLRELIRALRALAASHVQEAQDTREGIRKHVEVVEGGIADGVALLSETDVHVGALGASDASVLIVVCSEHGFVGAYNERLLDRAVAERRPGQLLVVVGRRGAMLAAERGLDVDRDFPMATHIGGVLGVTRHVAEELAFVSTADVVFGKYRKGGHFETAVRNILPLDPALLDGTERRSPPLHHLEPALLLRRLAGEYLFAEFTRAMMESLASENGARLRVMGAADRNIGERLDQLRRREQILRQESITAELLDVVTGSEAIFTESGR